MKLGVMCAMPEELSDILESIGNRHSREIGSRTYWEGTSQGVQVVAVFSRWGKVAAAATTAMLIEALGVDHILFVGVAGAIDPSLDLGDIVVATSLVQHDMDASAIPVFERFEIPLLAIARFLTDIRLTSHAFLAASRFAQDAAESAISPEVRATFSLSRPKVREGLIASGDRFVASAADVASLRAALPELLCVEMEGAAVAQICFEMDVPLSVVRIISDRADDSAPVDFKRFSTQVASILVAGIVGGFVEILAKDIKEAPECER